MSPLRHVAGLTLLAWALWPTAGWAGGWYLLIPPPGNVGDAPIREWKQLAAYEALAECRAEQGRARQAYADWWQREYRAAQRGRTATTDPRAESTVVRHPDGFRRIVAPLWFPGQEFVNFTELSEEAKEKLSQQARRRAWLLDDRGIHYPTFDALSPALDFLDRERTAPSPLPAAAPPPPPQAFDKPRTSWSVENRAWLEEFEKRWEHLPEGREWIRTERKLFAPPDLFDFERLLIIFTQGRCLASDDARLR